MYEEPLATIIEIQQVGADLTATLRIEGELYFPLAPASLQLMDEPETCVLDLHKAVQRNGHLVMFETIGGADCESPPVVGETYIFRSWWTPDQLALAQDSARAWEKQVFVPIDAAELYLEGGVRVLRPLESTENLDSGAKISGGWNHQHCALCWQRISPYKGDEATAYTSSGDWLCETCYQRYIKTGFGGQLGDQTS
jgi:hypothetical protein